MVYIIQNRMIWIIYDDRKFRKYFIPQYFPSWREEPDGELWYAVGSVDNTLF